MKKLYTFKQYKTEKVKEKETTENENGEKVTIEKEVDKKVTRDFFIRRPNRRLYDDAELYYAVKLSEGIKAGLLTKALLEKRYENDGGSLSDPEIERYGTLYSEFYENQRELIDLEDKSEKSESDKKRLDDLKEILNSTKNALTAFEMSQQNLFDQTAEVRARNKTILWWVLNLSYAVAEDGKEYPFFTDGSSEEKLEYYDQLTEEEDEFIEEVIKKFTYLISFWYVSKVDNEEDFKAMLEEQDLGGDLENLDTALEASDRMDEELKSEETPDEEAPDEETANKEQDAPHQEGSQSDPQSENTENNPDKSGDEN
mgnify:FL=1|tara:strand:+ start:27 stop:968 length:942 start_codon:yes stop_codon:yes gene_type:complete